MEHKIEYVISEGDFEHALGRKPNDQAEFEEFAHYCGKGLEAQIDWTVVVNCAKEQMRGQDGNE